MKAICHTKCQFAGRIWERGESLVLSEGQENDEQIVNYFDLEKKSEPKAKAAKKGKDEEF